MSSKLLCILVTFISITNYVYATPNIKDEIAQLEKSTEGRIGIYAINTQNGDVISYREKELFPTQSTYKILGAAAVLNKIQNEPNKLKQKIYFTKDDLDSPAFITGTKIDEGMTLNEICNAAVTVSDSGAMNIIIKELGGKESFNNFTKSLGNNILSSTNGWTKKVYSKDQHDNFTSTPKQMILSLKKISLGNVIPKPFRNLIISYLINSKTGDARIKAGTPNNWLVGNKTGSGSTNGTTNDIAIIWPQNHKPILLGIFYNSPNKKAELREDILAKVTSISIDHLIKNDSKLLK